MSKVAVYSRYTDTRADGTTIFWRTGKGSMRHASFVCANSKRSIFTGDCLVIPAAEVEQWTPCADCCTDADVTAARAAAAAKLDVNCKNSGVVHPQRIRSACKDCGKFGSVIPGAKLRAHLPLGVKRSDVTPAAPAAPAAAPVALEELKFPELMEIAKALNVPGRGVARKPELIAGIRAAQAAA